MDLRKKQVILLTFLILIFFAANYSYLDSKLKKFFSEKENVVITRVIDGDTVSLGNISVRLLGINTPERGEIYYAEAKKFLENRVINKTIELEYGKNKYDIYHRILAYIKLEEKIINKEIIENGFANYYFPSGRDRHYSEFKNAWENCIKKENNLCEKSKDKCSKCIVLNELNYKNQIVILENVCSFDCNLTGWKIKDEGRKNFVFSEFVLNKEKKVKIIVGEGKNNKENIFWKNEEYVWTKSGDTLFLRDEKEKLILWKTYPE